MTTPRHASTPARPDLNESLAQSLEFYAKAARREAASEKQEITEAVRRLIETASHSLENALRNSTAEGGSYPMRTTVGAELRSLRSKIERIEEALARLAIAEAKIDVMREVAEAARRFAPTEE